MKEIAIFSLLTLIAEVIGTISGFGSSLLFVPIASYFFDLHTVLGITAIFHIASNITKISLFRNKLDSNILFTIGIPSVVFVAVGAFLTRLFDSFYLHFALGGLLVLVSTIFLLKPSLEINPNKKNAIIGGSLSGFIAGLLGTGGAIRGITLAAYNIPKEIFVATSAVIDLGVDITRSAIYFSNGFVPKNTFQILPILFLVSIIGTLIGKKTLTYISQDKFRKFTLLVVCLSGFIALYNSFKIYLND